MIVHELIARPDFAKAVETLGMCRASEPIEKTASVTQERKAIKMDVNVAGTSGPQRDGRRKEAERLADVFQILSSRVPE